MIRNKPQRRREKMNVMVGRIVQGSVLIFLFVSANATTLPRVEH
jgi:hypothetical protein